MVWLIFGVGVLLAALWSKSNLPKMIVSASIATLCYVGILVFVSVSVVKSLRN